MEISQRVNSLFNSMSYAFSRVLVDPGDEWEGFKNVSVVLLTHAHFDHIYGLNELFEISPKAKVYTNPYGYEMLLHSANNLSHYHETPFVFEHPEAVVIVKDRQAIDLENGRVAIAVFTPGHNPSCISWVVDNLVFTGDSYIPGIKTITYLPKGDKIQAKESEALIKRISKDKIILPGHNVRLS